MAIDHPLSAPQRSSPETRIPWSDEVLEELYAYRAEYAARFDHDLQRIYEDLKAKEASNPLRRAEISPVEPQSGQ